MFIGTGVCLSCWYFVFYGEKPCYNELSNLSAGALMYGSYLYLFCEFAVKRYICPSTLSKGAKGSEGVAASGAAKKLN
jgi:hypothetical protein